MTLDIMTRTLGSLTAETVEELSRYRGEPEWLLNTRTEAWQTYRRLQMPSRHEEEWRRTDISMLDLDRVVPFVERGRMVGDPSELPDEIRGSLGAGDGLDGAAAQHNSTAVYRQLADELAGRGVILTDLATAAREHPDLVRSHLFALVPAHGSKLAAVHAALWNGGTFLYVPKNVEIDLPVHVLTWADAPDFGIMPHTLIVAEAGSSVSVIDEFASANSPLPSGEGRGEGRFPSLANSVAEISLGPGARLRYIALQRWGHSVTSFGTVRASVGRDAELNTLSVVLGSRLTKSWVEALLEESGAVARMTGIMFASGKQRFHHHTLQDHRAPNTTSDLLFKVALTDRGRSEYSGMIRVQKNAAQTDAYQANRNLLLSPNARADSMPKLEIENNDVRCTHGATVGPLDEEQLFYLMARGLPRAIAQRMIVEGFFEPVLERIPLESVRERVRNAIAERLG